MGKMTTEFFRNPEIKRDIIISLTISTAGVMLGFFLGTESGFLSLALTTVYMVFHFTVTFRRYQRIADLSQEIDQILHGQDKIPFEEYREGELAVLNNEIYKMLLRLREQAEALSKDKIYLTNSIADISHQLKTPLTSINLILSLLEQKDLSREQSAIHIIELKRLISRIDWLISSLLKLSKIDAGTAYFKKEEVVLEQLIRLALEPVAIPMELKEQELNISIKERASYIGDMAWSVEAVGNILKNCMEHTPVGGRIEITGAANTIYAELVIADNGKGIDPEDIPHIFERFYKGKHSGEQSVGIGLALARTIIMQQNGTIKVENRKEGGAKFTLRFYKMIY